MFDRILLPLDGSALSESAINLALLIPSRLVYLLRVEDEAPTVEHDFSPDGRELGTRWRFQDDGEHLDRAAARFRAQGREVEVLRTTGERAQRIIDMAVDVDLIVMATHARGVAGRAILGSIADRVVREAPAPTLLVRGDYQLASPPLTRILLPLDGSRLAEEALPVAAALAEALDLRLHLVRVVESVRTATGTRGTGSLLAPGEEARAYLDDRAERLRDRNLTVTWEVRVGRVVPELQAAIRPRDVVVMSTHGRSGVRRLVLGSIADALVRGASAPILLNRASVAAPAERPPEPEFEQWSASVAVNEESR